MRRQSIHKNVKHPIQQFEAMLTNGYLDLRSKEKGDAGSSLFLWVSSQGVHATVNVVLSLKAGGEREGEEREGEEREEKRGGMLVIICNMVKSYI